MSKDKLATARRVLAQVQDGTIPDSKCANCGNPEAELFASKPTELLKSADAVQGES